MTQTQQRNRDQTVTNISELVARANHESQADSHEPSIILLGPITKTINVDETVVSRIGQVDGIPAYWLVPRAYKITDDGGLKIRDDHPSWWQAGNDEEVTIPEAQINLGFICLTGDSLDDDLLNDTNFFRK